MTISRSNMQKQVRKAPGKSAKKRKVSAYKCGGKAKRYAKGGKSAKRG